MTNYGRVLSKVLSYFYNNNYNYNKILEVRKWQKNLKILRLWERN